MLPVVVSFYTLQTPYEQEVQGLIESCHKWGVEAEIEGVPSLGSWEKNCGFKPLFLLEKLDKLRRPLLWVDADGVFVQPLHRLPAFSSDIAVRMYDCPDDHVSRINTSTVFVHYTKEARHVLVLWAQECVLMLQDPHRTQEMWDQDALRRVLLEKRPPGTFACLPVSYGKIVGHPQDEKSLLDPVIVQNQASRRYKRWVNHPEERILGW